MGTIHHPRKGSLAYRPKKRARRIYPRIGTRLPCNETKALDFAGYKVGMTHIKMIESRKGSVNFNKEVTKPVTVVECPPIRIAGIRTYKKEVYGPITSQEIWAKDLEKDIKKCGICGKRLHDVEKIITDDISDVVFIAHTTPRSAGISKKKPDMFEIGIGGNNIEDKIKFAKEKLGNELTISEIFSEGSFVDTLAVTKGKGFQGAVKRYGVKTQAAWAEKSKRRPGNLGPFTPRKTRYTVPQAGQLGFHNRTELNKHILRIGDNPEDINVSGGFKNYGEIKSTYIIVSGSITGPAKRLIRFRHSIRTKEQEHNEINVTYVSKESKQ